MITGSGTKLINEKKVVDKLIGVEDTYNQAADLAKSLFEGVYSLQTL
jgi:hypothetical protein